MGVSSKAHQHCSDCTVTHSELERKMRSGFISLGPDKLDNTPVCNAKVRCMIA